jgi:hypothetical protein
MAFRAAIFATLLAVVSGFLAPAPVRQSGVILSVKIREKAGRVEYDLNPEDKPKPKPRYTASIVCCFQMRNDVMLDSMGSRG